jgi:hypothetical protein
MKTLTCQQCGGAMRRKKISEGNCSGLAIAMIAFCIGVGLFFIPVLGWVFGPLVCVCALFMGGRKRRVWKCKKCGSVIERA